MTSRRQFLQIGLAATAWPLASKAAHAAGIDFASASMPIYRVVVDRRFASSVEFGRRAESLGLSVESIAGDMTRFWFDELYHEWKRAPVAIAGLTAHGPMFCFEMLGRDQGLRVVFRGKHESAEGCVRHSMTGPTQMLAGTAEELSGARWSAALADVIARCPRGRSQIDTRDATAAVALADTGREPLYSWLIAPATVVGS